MAELRVQECGPGCTANQVVTQHEKLGIQDLAGPDTADRHGHSLAQIAVETRLWAVVLGQDLQQVIGGAGEIPTGVRTPVFFEGCGHVLDRRVAG